MFDATTPHGVSVVQGRRLSVALFIPTRHELVGEDLKQKLKDSGFPLNLPLPALALKDHTLPCSVLDSANGESVKPKGERARQGAKRHHKALGLLSAGLSAEGAAADGYSALSSVCSSPVMSSCQVPCTGSQVMCSGQVLRTGSQMMSAGTVMSADCVRSPSGTSCVISSSSIPLVSSSPSSQRESRPKRSQGRPRQGTRAPKNFDGFRPDYDICLGGLMHSNFRRFYRQLLTRSLKPCGAPGLAFDEFRPVEHPDILPMPLPFQEAPEVHVWPSSPRRVARIQHHRQRSRWCNQIICYFSWLALGKPGGLRADVRLLPAPLSSVQVHVRDQLWRDLGALFRPGAGFQHHGRGKISDLLAALAADCGGYACSNISGMNTVCLNETNMALPKAAAVVELTPPIVLPEIAEIFGTIGGLDLAPEEHPAKLPQMFMKVDNWSAIAQRLVQSGLAHVIPFEGAPRSLGRSLASGLFGVPKPGSELCRLIVDRRRKNACERSIREAACARASEESWEDEQLMMVIREMTLPHSLQFRDLFLCEHSYLHIDTKDAKDYFYLMALPPAQRHATPIGWPLKNSELDGEGDPDDTVMLALTAPAMGSKHSMEIAQATHHGVMRCAHVLE
eukprot:738405-Amphidinium_carterae.1